MPFVLEILKKWKEEGNNMHRDENGFSTEAHRGFVLDSKQKNKTQLQQLQKIWP